MILVAGDSWGWGEWPKFDPAVEYKPTHYGLSQYISDHGYKVHNLSVPGGSNYHTVNVIRKFVDRTINPEKVISKIFIFQTEWIRDYTGSDAVQDTNELLKMGYTELKNHTISGFYYSLSNFAKKYNIKIHVIGGCSDTFFLNKFEDEYPGVSIVCQSLTNLCINNNPFIEKPVFEVDVPIDRKTYLGIIEKIKKQSNDSDIEDFLNDQLRTNKRFMIWKYRKEFFPDGSHANKKAHKKLFDLLVNNQVI